MRPNFFASCCYGSIELSQPIPEAVGSIESCGQEGREDRQLCVDGTSTSSTEASVTYRDSSDFDVALQGGTHLGIDVNSRDQRTVLITRVREEGVVPRHNAACRSGLSYNRGGGITPGDRIIEVNGVRGDPHRMVEQLRTAASLQLTVRRLDELTVTVNREPGSKLNRGLQTYVGANMADSMTLEVERVQWGGVVMEPCRIERGDRIVALNGHSGDSVRLSWELEDAQLPSEFVIRRFRK